MPFLEQNVRGLCAKFGVDYEQYLSDFEVDHILELSLMDLEAFCEEYEVDLYALMFKPLFLNDSIKKKAKEIKLLICDVDGVMTDGGMYYTESGDYFKKYNAKDGMGIIKLQQKGIQVGIISSSFTGEMVQQRAKTLKIERVYVGERAKIDVLEEWCKELNLSMNQIAMVGDDINDLGIFTKVGLKFCPADAVQVMKVNADVVLNAKGGQGCVRELIDNYLLTEPLGS